MKKYKVYNKDGNTYVTESDLNSDYELALETSDVDDVVDYIVDCYGTILMEESIVDDICYYDYMCLVKNGNANEIIYACQDKIQWNHYLKYLLQWANDHSDMKYKGMSPACFDEFCDNDDDDYYDEKSFAEIIYELKFNEKEK